MRRIADAGMEIGSHTWEHPNMTTIPQADIPSQLSKATQAIAATVAALGQEAGEVARDPRRGGEIRQ